jgi:hypothetical protein
VKIFKKIFFCFIWIGTVSIFSSPAVKADEPDYPFIFGSNWQKACSYIEENKNWMQKTCSENKVDFDLVSSVIFPELVRYSALRDKIEITLLKALYVHYGAEYSNFSVGIFQIKPGCAQEILKHVSKLNEPQFDDHFSYFFQRYSEREKRQAIVRELEDPAREFYFVVALVRILEKKYSREKWENTDEKLRFYSAAYNAGFSSPEKYIRGMMTAKQFHTKLNKPAVTYCYPDISSVYFRTLKE